MHVNTRNSYLHGQSEVAASRYLALYLTQICWLALGAYLFANAYWPSTCQPDGVSLILISQVMGWDWGEGAAVPPHLHARGREHALAE